MPKTLLPKVLMAMLPWLSAHLVTTLVTLLRKLYSKHRRTPGQMLSEQPWRVAVYAYMFPKLASWPLDIPIRLFITNRTNLDLIWPSVNHPLFPAPCAL